MVYVQIDIQDMGEKFPKLFNSNNNVIYIAEALGFIP